MQLTFQIYFHTQWRKHSHTRENAPYRRQALFACSNFLTTQQTFTHSHSIFDSTTIVRRVYFIAVEDLISQDLQNDCGFGLFLSTGAYFDYLFLIPI